MKVSLLRKVLISSLAFGVMGCSFANLSPFKTPQANTQAQQALKGSLNITIRWPKYQTNLIPDSTSRIELTIKHGATLLRAETINRFQGEGTKTATYDVDALDGISVEAKAFRSDSGEAIAQGSQSSVNVSVGKTSNVMIVMTAMNVPAVTSTVPNHGAVGDAIEFNGTNLGLTATDSLRVVFPGGATASANWVSPTKLSTTIPVGAQCGTVSVTVDGVKSVSTIPFWVVDGITIDALDVSQTNIIYSQSVSLTVHPSWVGSLAGLLSEPPKPTWTIDANGGAVTNHSYSGGVLSATYTAGSVVGTYNVRAKMGPQIQSAPVAFNILADIQARSEALDLHEGNWVYPGDEGITVKP